MTHILSQLDVETCRAAADEGAGFGALETERGRLPLVSLNVEARISGLTAETVVRQTFRNSLDESLEATYIFPLPDRAAVTRFQMRVAGRTIDGDLKERGAAREEYDRAIQQGHRAAIAEEERSGVFNLRVGNIPPRQEATVELTLIGPLPVADGEATFRFPLVVAPRYTSGVPLDGPSVGAGVAPDTDESPDASRVTPPVLLPGFPNPVHLALTVQFDRPVEEGTGNWFSRLRSSLHSVVAGDGPPWTVQLQPGERLDRDFILRFPVAGASIATSLQVSPAAEGKAGVFALTLIPPAAKGGRPRPRDILFVLDRSGSMDGWKMVAARRALGRMIDSLLDQDRFSVLAFDNALERPPQAADRFLPGSDRQRWRTLEWLGSIEARGGTEMGPALDEAMRLLAVGAGSEADAKTRERILVLVTDGQVTGEDAILRRLGKEQAGNPVRIFTVGIDQAVNAGFLKRLADLGRGECELVESEDRLDAALDRIHRLIGAPVLTQVRLEPVNFDWVAGSLAPARLPDLFADRPVVLFGRHLAGNAAVSLKVHALDAQGNPWQQEVVGRSCAAGMLTSLWGRSKVRDLEDQYACGGDQAKLMRQIVEVSLESRVLSRFTAYVAVDHAEVVNAGGQVHQIVQPVEMPQVWAMAAAAPMMRGVMLAKGAPASMGAASFGLVGRAVKKLRSLGTGVLEYKGKDRGDVHFEEAESANSPLGDFDDLTTGAGDVLSSPPASDRDALGEAAIARLATLILTEALRLRASEIRIDRLSDRVRIQYLIDGNLAERESPPVHLFDAILGWIKIMAKLDMAEHDKPQQGQMQVSVGQRKVTVEVRISAASDGHSIVLALPPEQPAGSAKPKQGVSAGRKLFWT